ncbi:hypothetical protein AOA80_02155 [Methanomassiliicoccales archaeon RumEn M1]|jgi:hypothetical protein|nr:hypothetical protein AOA80_02155 [Methanomassiliicoccales archaeon RumEn M1]
MGPRIRRAERKVPGGKLVQMTVDHDGAIRLTGDFFLHPEDELADLESFLSSLPRAGRDETVTLVREYVQSSGVTMIGLRPEDLADLLAEVRP